MAFEACHHPVVLDFHESLVSSVCQHLLVSARPITSISCDLIASYSDRFLGWSFFVGMPFMFRNPILRVFCLFDVMSPPWCVSSKSSAAISFLEL